MMPNLFESSHSKIARGKKHIKDFHEAVADFDVSIVEEKRADPDPQIPDGILHKVKIKPIPTSLVDIASDAACNLRDALDHAVYAAAVASGVAKPKTAAFPFAGDVNKFGFGRCKQAPQDICALLATFKPYKGGNDLLWALSEVSNTYKHVALKPMGITASQIVFQATSVGRGHTILNPPRWDPANNEIVLATSWADSNFNCHLQATFDIAFDKVDVLDGKKAIVVFDLLSGIVESIVMAIEAETRRLFPNAFQ